MVISVVQSWTPCKSMADFGRLELKKAEAEMPGLMACRTEFVPSQPLKDIKITVSLNMTAQTAVFVETLTALGAQVRWCSGSISSTVDHVAAAIARNGTDVFAWKDQTPKEYWLCKVRALDWGPSGGPHLILDHSGDLTMLICEGTRAEKEFASTGIVPDPACTDDVTFKAMLAVIGEGLSSDPMKFHKINDGIVGATMETPTGANMLQQMQNSGILLYPAISDSESVSKIKYSTGGFQSLPDDLMNATNVMIAGKVALVAGHGDIGIGCAAAFSDTGRAIIVVTEGRPMNFSCATGPPNCAISSFWTNQVIALLELWNERSSGKYEKVYDFPKHLDQKKVAALHFETLGEDQADHICVQVVGDNQPANDVQVEDDDNQPANNVQVEDDDNQPANDVQVEDDDKQPANNVQVEDDDNQPADEGQLVDHISLQVEGDDQPAEDRFDWWQERIMKVTKCVGGILAVVKLVQMVFDRN